jgi:hypothetical protein
MSTALLISAVALPVSVIAFAVVYVNHDSTGAGVWLMAGLPGIWLSAVVFGIRDAVRRHSWRQMAGVVVLLAPTVLLVNSMGSPRFWYHQLFTFRPLDLHLPTNGFVLMEKFTVREREQPCKSRGMVTKTHAFNIKKIPDGCCSLAVISDRSPDRRVGILRVVLNGQEVKLESQRAAVNLNWENEISVQLSGAPDAYIYVLISYTGKMSPPST